MNTYFPKLIATILKALREQLRENDLLNFVEEIAEPEIHLAYDQILKEGGRFWDDVNGGSLPEDLVLVARREEIDRVFSVGENEIVSNARVQGCRHETVGSDLDGHLQVRGSSAQEMSIEICV